MLTTTKLVKLLLLIALFQFSCQQSPNLRPNSIDEAGDRSPVAGRAMSDGYYYLEDIGDVWDDLWDDTDDDWWDYTDDYVWDEITDCVKCDDLPDTSNDIWEIWENRDGVTDPVDDEPDANDDEPDAGDGVTDPVDPADNLPDANDNLPDAGDGVTDPIDDFPDSGDDLPGADQIFDDIPDSQDPVWDPILDYDSEGSYYAR